MYEVLESGEQMNDTDRKYLENNMPHPDDFKMISEEELKQIEAWYMPTNVKDHEVLKLIHSYRKQREELKEVIRMLGKRRAHILSGEKDYGMCDTCYETLTKMENELSFTPPRTEGEGE